MRSGGPIIGYIMPLLISADPSIFWTGTTIHTSSPQKLHQIQYKSDSQSWYELLKLLKHDSYHQIYRVGGRKHFWVCPAHSLDLHSDGNWREGPIGGVPGWTAVADYVCHKPQGHHSFIMAYAFFSGLFSVTASVALSLFSPVFTFVGILKIISLLKPQSGFYGASWLLND